jgi:ABC-type multidrug transport system fused ATPase/permease subunit
MVNLFNIKRKIQDGSLKEMWIEAKWILGYIKRYKAQVAFYIFLFSIGAIFGLLNAVASKYLIDSLANRQIKVIVTIAVIYISFGLFEILTGALTNRITSKIDLRVINDIRIDIYDSILNIDSEHLMDFHSGDLLNRINSDARTVAGSVVGMIPSFVTRVLQFTGSFIIIMYFDYVMAILALASAPVSMIVSDLLVKKMRKHNKKMREASSKLMSYHEESFVNIAAIKALGLKSVFTNRHKEQLENFKTTSLDYNKFSIHTHLFMSITGLIVSYLCFGWAVFRLYQGFITFGTMVLFLQLAGMLRSSFSSLISLIPSSISATTSAGRIMEIIEKPTDDCDATNDEQTLKSARKRGVVISLEDVSFSYRKGKKVFEDACILARPGETIALVGPSGGGKTTLLKILLGQLKHQKGRLGIYPFNEKHKNIVFDDKARLLFSYVPQDNMLFSGTIADNLRLAKPDATEEEIKDALVMADAYDFVSNLPDGINSNVEERGKNFSEGQIQRLSIARALIRKAPILLLDEATSSLDVDTERKILMNIKRIKGEVTCILTTHRPSVLGICDRVYRVSGGKCTLFGGGESLEPDLQDVLEAY